MSENFKLIWSSQTSEDAKIVFGNAETEAPGSLYSVYIPSIKGRAWQYLKPKDAVSYRCESRNIRVGGYLYTWAENTTYRIVWSSMFPDINSEDDIFGTYVIFQWKSYPNGQQNYPFLMTVKGNMLNLIYVDTAEKWHTIWTQPAESLTWMHFDITLHLSRDADQGWLELSFNDTPQNFSNGASRWIGRTLDNEKNEPKWGCYDRGNPSRSLIHYMTNAEVYKAE